MVISRIKSIIGPLKYRFGTSPDPFLQGLSGVVHVGANVGQERNLYQSYGLKVLWIEPIPSVFAELQRNIQAYSKQSACQALVTDVDGQSYQFNIANNKGASSSILPFKKHKDIWPEVDYTTTVTMTGVTLDSLFKQQQIKASNYQALIMDTQGTELLVLKGGLTVLKHFQYIKTEVPDFEAYEGCCQLTEMNDFMTAQGYEEFSRTSFASRAEGGSYFDVVYRRRAA